jgi:hypothetical protein
MVQLPPQSDGSLTTVSRAIHLDAVSVMRRSQANHYLLLIAGWTSLAMGLVMLPIPVPMPVPVAVILLVGGVAILTSQSRGFRNALRFARFRHAWLSHLLELFSQRAPLRLQRVMYRTRPDLVVRLERMRATRAIL